MGDINFGLNRDINMGLNLMVKSITEATKVFKDFQSSIDTANRYNKLDRQGGGKGGGPDGLNDVMTGIFGKLWSPTGSTVAKFAALMKTGIDSAMNIVHQSMVASTASMMSNKGMNGAAYGAAQWQSNERAAFGWVPWLGGHLRDTDEQAKMRMNFPGNAAIQEAGFANRTANRAAIFNFNADNAASRIELNRQYTPAQTQYQLDELKRFGPGGPEAMLRGNLLAREQLKSTMEWDQKKYDEAQEVVNRGGSATPFSDIKKRDEAGQAAANSKLRYKESISNANLQNDIKLKNASREAHDINVQRLLQNTFGQYTPTEFASWGNMTIAQQGVGGIPDLDPQIKLLQTATEYLDLIVQNTNGMNDWPKANP